MFEFKMTEILALVFLVGAVFAVKATPEIIRVKRWGGDQGDDLSSMFRGTAGVDYPNYKTIPQSSFRCSDQLYPGGLYADVETQCQVYHVCHEGRKDSFLCGKGTVFNQQILACDYWYSTECENAPNYYYLNAQVDETQSNPIHGSGQLQKTPSGAGYSQGIQAQNIPRAPQKKPGNQYTSGQSGYNQNDQQNQGGQQPYKIGGNSGSSQYSKPSQSQYGQNQQGTLRHKIVQHENKKLASGQYHPESLPGDTGYYNPDQIPGESGQYQPASIPGDSGQYQPESIPGDSGQYQPASIPGDSGQYYPENLPGESGQHSGGGGTNTQGQHQPNRPHTGSGRQKATGQGGNRYQPVGNQKTTVQHQTVSQGSSGYQPTYPIAQKPLGGQSPQFSSISNQHDQNQFRNNPPTSGISRAVAAPVVRQNQGHNSNTPGAVTVQRQQSGPWSFPNGGMMMMGGPGDR